MARGSKESPVVRQLLARRGRRRRAPGGSSEAVTWRREHSPEGHARSLRTAVRAALAALVGVGLAAAAQTARAEAVDHSFVTSDGVRLHYIEAGHGHARTLVFVPGWTMPAWIFDKQIDAL